MLKCNLKTANEVINFFYQQSNENEIFFRNNIQYLSKNQLNWKSNPDSWCVGECLSHLIVSHRAYFPKFQTALDNTYSDNKEDFKFRNTIFGKFIMLGVDPDNKSRVKTQKVFLPSSASFELQIFTEYAEIQKQTRDFVSQMKNLDLAKIKISSPANRFLRMNIGDALLILVIHDTRHLHQAKRVTELIHFPLS